VRASSTVVVTAVAAGLVAGFVAGATGCAPAAAAETFFLEQHDKILAEAPGCYAECVLAGPRRSCTVKGFGCRASCSTLPECRPDGLHPITVCAIVPERR
jgi:hypothetical protein